MKVKMMRKKEEEKGKAERRSERESGSEVKESEKGMGKSLESCGVRSRALLSPSCLHVFGNIINYTRCQFFQCNRNTGLHTLSKR